jgi:hypothetical protein
VSDWEVLCDQFWLADTFLPATLCGYVCSFRGPKFPGLAIERDCTVDEEDGGRDESLNSKVGGGIGAVPNWELVRVDGVKVSGDDCGTAWMTGIEMGVE